MKLSIWEKVGRISLLCWPVALVSFFVCVNFGATLLGGLSMIALMIFSTIGFFHVEDYF